MEGTEGISQMLGMLLLLDSSIGEKADPGLKMMFQTIKTGSAGFIRLKKDMGRGVEFTADMTAMDKILATLISGKGREAAELVFTADARVVYDELAKPFDEAMEKSLAAGFSKKDAMDKAMAAFRQNLDDSAVSTMKYSKIIDEKTKRIKEDPLIKLNVVMANLAEAFTQPKMIAAMNKLADKLPAFADAVANVIDYILDNPWETIAMVVAAKVGMAFAGAAVSKAVAGGMARLLGGQAAASGVSAAAASLGAGGAGAGAATIAGGGGAGLLATLGGGVATAGAGLVAGVAGAGLAVGGAAGYAGYKYASGGEAAQQGELEAGRRAQFAVTTAGMAAGGTSEQKMSAAILELSAAKQALANNVSILNTIVGDAAAQYAGVEAPTETRARNAREIENAEQKLRRALDDLRTNAGRAADAMGKVGDADTSRGPMTAADPSPGADPKGG